MKESTVALSVVIASFFFTSCWTKSIADSATYCLYHDCDELKKIMLEENFGGLGLGLTEEQTVTLLGRPDTIIVYSENQFYYDYTSQSIQLTFGIDTQNKRVINSMILNSGINNLTSACVLKNSKNIGIGSSLEDLKQVYGENLRELNKESVYAIGHFYRGIRFQLAYVDKEVPTVSSIIIGELFE